MTIILLPFTFTKYVLKVHYLKSFFTTQSKCLCAYHYDKTKTKNVNISFRILSFCVMKAEPRQGVKTESTCINIANKASCQNVNQQPMFDIIGWPEKKVPLHGNDILTYSLITFGVFIFNMFILGLNINFAALFVLSEPFFELLYYQTSH